MSWGTTSASTIPMGWIVVLSPSAVAASCELTDSNPKGLKILKFTNPTTGLSYFYYIEYRQPLGFDSFIASMAAQNETNGVVVHLAQQGNANSSDLLDMTPDSSTYFDWNDVALVVGASYSDPDAGITIAPISVSSSGASVSVTITTPACSRALPTVAISPAQAGSFLPGTLVTYTVTGTDNDASNCGTSTFNLQSAIPYGWTEGLSNTQLTLSPGANSSISLSVTSASNSVNGPEPIGATATNSADLVYTSSGWATYVIGTPMNVAVSTNQASYKPGQSVTVTATATSNGSPVPNASTTFNINQPNGGAVQGSGTTGANGVASFTLKLSRKSSTGTYAAGAQANKNGSSGSGSTTFQVQ